MQTFWNVVQVACMVVGAWTLVAALFASIWTALVRGRREGTVHDRRTSTGHDRRRSTTVDDGNGSERRAQSWDEVPGWVTGDREWAVAVVLLGAPAVAARTDAFVNFSERSIDWPGLLLAAASWSEDDRLLVYTAYDLAGASRVAGESLGGERVTLQQMADVGDDLAARLQVAIDVRRGRMDYLTAVVRTNGRD
jgi:hypothetical protein